MQKLKSFFYRGQGCDDDDEDSDSVDSNPPLDMTYTNFVPWEDLKIANIDATNGVFLYQIESAGMCNEKLPFLVHPIQIIEVNNFDFANHDRQSCCKRARLSPKKEWECHINRHAFSQNDPGEQFTFWLLTRFDIQESCVAIYRWQYLRKTTSKSAFTEKFILDHKNPLKRNPKDQDRYYKYCSRMINIID